MASARDGYIPPVGFAREPHAEIRRWTGRVVFLALVLFLAWLLRYRVLSPADTTDAPRIPVQTELPGPV